MAMLEYWMMIILASRSPRRKDLLSWLGVSFKIQPGDVDESILLNENPRDYVVRLGKEKARAVRDVNPSDVIVSADTAVVDGETILGKPENEDIAFQFLKQLRGRKHIVVSGLCIDSPALKAPLTEICQSDVLMLDYTDKEMIKYIATGDPMDKAGAYAVQNDRFHPVINFDGCFANVMGLPLCHLMRTLKKIGIKTEADVPSKCLRNLSYDCHISQRILHGEDVG